MFSLTSFRGSGIRALLKTLWFRSHTSFDETRRSVSDLLTAPGSVLGAVVIAPWDSNKDRETSTGSAFLLQKSQRGKQFNQRAARSDCRDWLNE